MGASGIVLYEDIAGERGRWCDRILQSLQSVQ